MHFVLLYLYLSNLVIFKFFLALSKFSFFHHYHVHHKSNKTSLFFSLVSLKGGGDVSVRVNWVR
jgi:hypothetical protein